ncbi:PPC domain-containing DNA-binding protein [Roseibacillus persicicus]|uniref:PPC domain-containing DNA-binding protein n=1 Tax=Roseibacillus persicicus TaxID=454148 RepID=UPI00398B1A16
MKTYALRLQPEEDPKEVLDALMVAKGWTAACVICAVGSLTHAALRYANQPEAQVLTGPFEIVGLTGTLSPNGSHLHLTISDGSGTTLGGHLKEGSRVYTTVEIVLAILDEWSFSREVDEKTGYLELSIEPR